MGFCTHRSTRARADAGNALDHMVDGSANFLLALDGFQALRLMIISASNAPSDDSPWAPLFSVGSPALPENESPQLALSSESGTMEGLYVHFAALPLPPSHGLPLGFVAQPAAMTSARKFVDALETWSGLTDAPWDYLDNPCFDVWFAAQAIDPDPFVIDLCSIPQIQPDWSRWMGTLPPPNQEAPQDWGSSDIMQHVAAMLKHRVFRDALLTKASK